MSGRQIAKPLALHSRRSPLTICSRIGNSVHLLDPLTLQQTDVSAPVYWRTPFDSLATVTDLVEFVVLDIEAAGPSRGKYVLADAQVTRASGTTSTNEDGMGNDGIFHVRTHLGAILQPGDIVLGYHLTHSNFNSSAFEDLDPSRVPDVILVKKTYPSRRRKARPRNWKLRSIAKEAEEAEPGTIGRGALGRRGGVDQKNVERDYELFLRDLEEDKEMRAAINLYRNDPKEVKDPDGDVGMSNGPKAGSGLQGGKKRSGRPETTMEVEEERHGHDDAGADEDDEDDFPEIAMGELLEHFGDMDVNDELDGGQEVK